MSSDGEGRPYAEDGLTEKGSGATPEMVSWEAPRLSSSGYWLVSHPESVPAARGRDGEDGYHGE